MATELTAYEDEKLMELVKQHDSAAFEVLVRRHTQRFYALAYRTLARKEEAEDAVQDCFLKLWKKPQLWNEKHQAKFTTWFYKLVVNRCLDIRKKKKPDRLVFEDEIADTADNQVETLDKQRQQASIEHAIQALPERQRTALNLCFYEELSNQEAADIMGVKLKALQSLLMRAKTNLSQSLNIKGD